MTDETNLQKCKIIQKNFSLNFNKRLEGSLAQTAVPFPVLGNEILKALLLLWSR